MKKLLFFDIDGTLVDDDGSIPASTIQAIASAQKAGHLTFINTGRTWGNVDLELRAIGFDGFICGCGTEIIYRNQVLFHQQVKPELCASIRELVRSCNATPLYERSDTMFYDPTMPKHPAFCDLMKIYERKQKDVQDLTDHADFSFDKFVIWYDEQTDLKKFQDGIAADFDFIDRENGFAEMVPKNCSKATGMQQLVDYLQMDMKDTIAFGDSLNDLPMMQAANIAVGMGNGTSLRPYVTFITKDIKENGIYEAMKQLNLLSLS